MQEYLENVSLQNKRFRQEYEDVALQNKVSELEHGAVCVRLHPWTVSIRKRAGWKHSQSSHLPLCLSQDAIEANEHLRNEVSQLRQENQQQNFATTITYPVFQMPEPYTKPKKTGKQTKEGVKTSNKGKVRITEPLCTYNLPILFAYQTQRKHKKRRK